MLTLPIGEPERARAQLAHIANGRRHAVIVVLGSTPRAREIAACAEARASGHSLRRVVLVPDPAVLARDARFAWLAEAAAQGAEAVAVTLDFHLSARLSGAAALDAGEMEEAFLNATTLRAVSL